MKALKEFDARGYVICNSPNLEKDAKMLKDFFMIEFFVPQNYFSDILNSTAQNQLVSISIL